MTSMFRRIGSQTKGHIKKCYNHKLSRDQHGHLLPDSWQKMPKRSKVWRKRAQKTHAQTTLGRLRCHPETYNNGMGSLHFSRYIMGQFIWSSLFSCLFSCYVSNQEFRQKFFMLSLNRNNFC